MFDKCGLYCILKQWHVFLSFKANFTCKNYLNNNFLQQFSTNSDKLNIPLLTQRFQEFLKVFRGLHRPFSREICSFPLHGNAHPVRSYGRWATLASPSVRLSSLLTGLPSGLLCLHLRLLWLADTSPASNVDPPSTDTGGRAGLSPWFPIHPPPRQHWKIQRSWKSFDADWLRIK